MTPAAEQSIASLVGVCRENQRTLAEAGWTAKNRRVRSSVLAAFDQCTDMLHDLERFAPGVPVGEAVHVGWHPRRGEPDDTVVQVCVTGEEITLRAAQALWAGAIDRDLRRVLQVHIVRMSGAVAQFRALGQQIHNY